MKYSKLPQWMRDKIFSEPGGVVVIAFKYNGDPFEYWRNVGIVADIMGPYCHMVSGLGVHGIVFWNPESQSSYHCGTVRLSEFVTGYPGLPAELDHCLKRLELHRVEYTTCATAPRFMFNGKNTVSNIPLALHLQAPTYIGLYDENWVIDWLYRNRQAQNYNRYDWPYYYVAGCDCDDEDDYYDD